MREDFGWNGDESLIGGGWREDDGINRGGMPIPQDSDVILCAECGAVVDDGVRCDQCGHWVDAMDASLADEADWEAYRDDCMDDHDPYSDVDADADTFASAGWGTDEDYGCYDGGEW